MLIDVLMLRLEEAKRSHDNLAALPVLLIIAIMGGIVSRLDLNPYKDSLVPLVVSYVLESGSAELPFRRAAQCALSALVQNTGFVIWPYVEHPTLLPRLLELLRSETDAGVRLEVEKLLGSLGAVDPDEHKYASLPLLSNGARFPHHARTADHSSGRSLMRGNSARGSLHYTASSLQRPESGPGWRSTAPFGYGGALGGALINAHAVEPPPPDHS